MRVMIILAALHEFDGLFFSGISLNVESLSLKFFVFLLPKQKGYIIIWLCRLMSRIIFCVDILE